MEGTTEQRLPHIPLEEAAAKAIGSFWTSRRLDGIHYEAAARRWTAGNAFIAAIVEAAEMQTPPEADLFIPRPIVDRARKTARARNEGRHNWTTKYRPIVEYTPDGDAAPRFHYDEAANLYTLQPSRLALPPDYSNVLDVTFPWMLGESSQKAAEAAADARAQAEAEAKAAATSAYYTPTTTQLQERDTPAWTPPGERDKEPPPEKAPRVLSPAFTVEARALHEAARLALEAYDAAQEWTKGRQVYAIQILAATGEAAYHWRPQTPDMPPLDYSLGGPPRAQTLDAAAWTPQEAATTPDLVMAIDTALLYRLARAVQEPVKMEGRRGRHNFPITIWYDRNVSANRHAAFYVTPGDIEAAYKADDHPLAYGVIMPIMIERSAYASARSDYRGT